MSYEFTVAPVLHLLKSIMILNKAIIHCHDSSVFLLVEGLNLVIFFPPTASIKVC